MDAEGTTTLWEPTSTRNKVIAAKCMVTALPFTKRPARATLHPTVYRSRRHKQLTEIPREGDVNREWDCSRGHPGKCGRRLIENAYHNRATVFFIGSRITFVNVKTSTRFRIAAQKKGVRLCSETSSPDALSIHW